MKPSAFEYFAPGTVKEAVELLERYGEKAKILAGGQSLVPIMNFRLARPEVLIDINALGDLEHIGQDGDELVIGALTRERDVELSQLVRQKCPVLSEAVSHIGHTPIRNRGTIGGSLAHADPSAEIPTVVCALDATIKAYGPQGERSLKAGEFFLTYLTSSLEPSEVLVEIRVPVLADATGWSFMELSRRSGDFAVVAVATVVFMGHDGTCKEARIALGGVAATPVRAQEAEQLLSGRILSKELIEKAGLLAVESTDAESDYHATADYRREMTRVLVAKTLEQAVKKAGQGV